MIGTWVISLKSYFQYYAQVQHNWNSIEPKKLYPPTVKCDFPLSINLVV